MMIPKTDTAMARLPCLWATAWEWAWPVPEATIRATLAAGRTAPWAGIPPDPTMSHIRAKAKTKAGSRRAPVRPLTGCTGAIGFGPPAPLREQEGVTVDVMLLVIDPLPTAEEGFLGEAGKLGCPL
jgi:hypothetical protein